MKKLFAITCTTALCLLSVVCCALGAETANSQNSPDPTTTQTETATATDTDPLSTTATEELQETRIDASVAVTTEEESWEPTTTTERQISTTLATEPELRIAYSSNKTILTETDVETLAALLYLEGGGTSWDCQVALCSSILNFYDKMREEDSSYTFYEHCHSTRRYSPAESIGSTVPNQMQYDVIEAVMNGERVADVMYFYAVGVCNSSWHETQKFVCEYDGVRFFTRWTS